MVVEKRACAYCGRKYGINTLWSHERSCRKRPPDQELSRLYFGGCSATRMCQIFGVKRWTLDRWLEDAGLRGQPRTVRRTRQCNTPEKFKFIGEHVFPLADPIPLLAPLWGQGGGCANCGHETECRRRIDQLDLWPLCQIPTRRDVAMAYLEGRIGFDGDMPEWLPETVEELTP